MAHLLGYRNLATKEGFFKTEFYTSVQIDEIPDPEGGNNIKPPTSIPSPFAAIDLTKNAFKRIINSNDLKGTKIDQKLVSQSFDVGEMFFNSRVFEKDLKIIEWSKKHDLGALINASKGSGARILGDTLKMFLDQDREAYNFDNVDSLYILKYKYHVIGGTSPATLFFASLNPLESNVDVKVKISTEHTLFDTTYKALYEREDDFQLYIYYISKSIRGFGRNMPELQDYLDKNLVILRRINADLFEKIQNLVVDNYSDEFDTLTTGDTGSAIMLNGLPLRQRKQKEGGESDFKIQSIYEIEKPPLVLTPNFGGRSSKGQIYKYFDCDYTENIKSAIPYSSEIDIEERNLPGLTNQKYPYLLVSDFLEDSIIKMIYPINREKYFDGNLGNTKRNQSFLLPIRSSFFKYFDTNYLLNERMYDGKPAFEMEEKGEGSVKVTLRIKTNKEYIEIDRTYISSGDVNDSDANIMKNEGGMKELIFGVNIFPFVKTNPEITANHYRVQKIDIERNYKKAISNLEFYKNNNPESIKIERLSSKTSFEGDEYNSEFYFLSHSFDYVRVYNEGTTAIIIPKFKNYKRGSDIFKFSVDFGTTNTHLEYSVNGSNPEPFNITTSDMQVGTLFDWDFVENSPGNGRHRLLETLINEFIPLEINKDSEFRFPQRTALAEKKHLNHLNGPLALTDFNIPFGYEKRGISRDDKISTNLKWTNYVQDTEDNQRVKAFLEILVLLIKAKITLNEGRIDKSEIIWFYPSSMIPNRRRELSSIWEKLVRDNLGSQFKISSLSESVAPFYFYNKKLGVGSMERPAVSIDIGGGTTDVVIFQDKVPQYLTSFRFAANNLFGDGYSSSPERNGFVITYQEYLKEMIAQNRSALRTLNPVFNDITKSQSSSDIMAFFFSLENNRHVVKNNLNLSINEKLGQDENLKIVILLFYAAIIYHVAKFMKKFKLKSPWNIILSGNGSKIMNILDMSTKLDGLSKYSSFIFKKVYETDLDKVRIEQHESPKSVTCKGGLLYDNVDSHDLDEIMEVMVGTNKDFERPQYTEVNDEIIESVLDEVDEFIEMFYALNSDYNYFREFSINASMLKDLKVEMKNRDRLREYLRQGLHAKNKELSGNEDIKLEETLFFYPLIGLINRLAFMVTEK